MIRPRRFGEFNDKEKSLGVLLTKLARLMYGAKTSTMAIPERGKKRSIDKKGGQKKTKDKIEQQQIARKYAKYKAYVVLTWPVPPPLVAAGAELGKDGGALTLL